MVRLRTATAGQVRRPLPLTSLTSSSWRSPTFRCLTSPVRSRCSGGRRGCSSSADFAATSPTPLRLSDRQQARSRPRLASPSSRSGASATFGTMWIRCSSPAAAARDVRHRIPRCGRGWREWLRVSEDSARCAPAHSFSRRLACSTANERPRIGRTRETLAKLYPRVCIESDPIFVRDGRVYTSAGVTAGMDLALALVEEDFGRHVALGVARQLVMFLQRPGGQSQFSSQLAIQTADREPLRELVEWIADHLASDLRCRHWRERVAMSPRHFARMFTAEMNMTPARFVEVQRVEAARRGWRNRATASSASRRPADLAAPK